MTKKELREEYREKRLALSLSEIENYSLKIAQNLLDLLPETPAKVHTFLPIKRLNEIDTYLIMQEVKRKKPWINWIISQSDFESLELFHFKFDETTVLVENKYGIPEPLEGEEIAIDDIDLVLVPLLAFDKEGKRIGYGKGFYDRFLAQCAPNCSFIGLSFFDMHPNLLPVGDWDIALNFCITPEQKFKF